MTTVDIILSISVLLTLSALTLYISKIAKLPYTILLILVGMLYAALLGQYESWQFYFPQLEISTELILYVCLPTLIFEAAFHIDIRSLRRNIIPILLLAVPGLFISTLVMALFIYYLTPLSLLDGLLLGAILSATDPVAVLALFKQFGVEKRLNILVEGESILNDASAIVLANTILVVMVAGTVTSDTILTGMWVFIREFFGGALVGFCLSVPTIYCLGFVRREPLIELSLIIVMAYVSFILATDYFHASGVMATLTVGLILGGWGYTKIEASTQRQLTNLLELLVYIANALIFLLIGFNVNFFDMVNASFILFILIIAMLISRALIIFGLVPIIGKLPAEDPIDKRYQTVLWWGGLRGAIAIAIVLSLPAYVNSQLLETLVMGAVLFSILVQGGTTRKVISWLQLDKTPLSDQLAKLESDVVANEDVIKQIPGLKKGGVLSQKIASLLDEDYFQLSKQARSDLQAFKYKKLTAKQECTMLFIRSFSSEMIFFHEMLLQGHIPEHVYKDLKYIINIQLDSLRFKGEIINIAPHTAITTTLMKIANELSKRKFLSTLVEHYRVKKINYDYHLVWSLYQGALQVLEQLELSQRKTSVHEKALQKVIGKYKEWCQVNKNHLDDYANQFPEFVIDIQTRLGGRLLLHAKKQSLLKMTEEGLLPQSIAKPMIEKIEDEVVVLSKRCPEKLSIDPFEVLSKISFFECIPVEEFKKIIELLEIEHIPKDTDIIKEGELSDSLFFVIRGAVRILKKQDNKQLEVATLMAGDFFGEIGLLHGVKRTATCRAATACILQRLNREDLEKILQYCPVLTEALSKAAKERGYSAEE